MTDYLERASVARSIKALLVRAARGGRAAAIAAAPETRSDNLPGAASDIAVAGAPILRLSA